MIGERHLIDPSIRPILPVEAIFWSAKCHVHLSAIRRMRQEEPNHERCRVDGSRTVHDD
jgi:hypothetical protein